MLTLKRRLELAMERLKQRDPSASRAALARACGVKEPSVHAWFSGKTLSIKAEPVRLAADYLGCDRDWLSSGRGLPGWDDTPGATGLGSGPHLRVVIDEPRRRFMDLWPFRTVALEDIQRLAPHELAALEDAMRAMLRVFPPAAAAKQAQDRTP